MLMDVVEDQVVMQLLNGDSVWFVNLEHGSQHLHC